MLNMLNMSIKRDDAAQVHIYDILMHVDLRKPPPPLCGKYDKDATRLTFFSFQLSMISMISMILLLELIRRSNPMILIAIPLFGWLVH